MFRTEKTMFRPPGNVSQAARFLEKIMYALDDLEAGVSGQCRPCGNFICATESASVSRKGGMLAGARHES